jgi:hypothetical protein
MPGTIKASRIEKYKGKRKTEKRKKQRANRTLKYLPNSNNQYENNQYEENVY